MGNNKITQLPNLTPTQAQPSDLIPVVDVFDPASPSGNTKNMTLGQLSQYVTANQGLVSSSAQIILGDAQGPNPVDNGGTGTTYFSNGVLVGNGTDPVTAVSGTVGQVFAQTSGGPAPITGVVSSSAQVSFPSLSNIPPGLVSHSLGGLFSSSAQVSFIGEKDTPSSYTPNALLISNMAGTALEFVSGSEPSVPINQELIGGRSFANGTFYFNGDIRERIYSNPNVDSLYTGSNSLFYENFIHSGNITYDKVNENIYFVRGTWPRRQGSSSADLKGYTWRESNPSGLSAAEAICSTRDDGQNFEVVLDLYGSDFMGSGLSSVKSGSAYVVSEPSAVVFDPTTNFLYFSCRNDHDNSIVYRITISGSQYVTDSGIQFARMYSGDLKTDSLDLVTIPQNYYATGSPSENTQVLLIGVSPDYNANTNISSHKNAALFMVPTSSPPVQFETDYPQTDTLHLFWASSFDA